jgi:hypothetical protein
VTLGKPFANDFWFSGHVANAFVIALATRGQGRLCTLIWSGVVFETVLVLTTRTHYSIDVIGGLSSPTRPPGVVGPDSPDAASAHHDDGGTMLTRRRS